MKTLHILPLKKPLPSTLHTISKSVYKSISVVVLLMTAFTVVLAPSGVHADKPTLQTIKVLTTDASGNSAPQTTFGWAIKSELSLERLLPLMVHHV